MSQRQILLNPGPVTLTERVRAAFSRGDWCHREVEFADLTKAILASLETVYAGGPPMRAVLLTGSGTAAVEAMLATLAPPDSQSLVAANGVYGERMAAMLQAHRRALACVSSPWEQGIDLEEVERELVRNPGIRTVVAVHHETTTGRLNDLPALADLCRRHGCLLLLDAVSSFGAEAIDLDSWPIAAVAATANKCLHGSPGLSFVLVREDVLRDIDWEVGSVYFDLRRYATGQHGDGFSPFTQAVQVAFALQEALTELEECGGQAARLARYRAVAERVRDCLAGLGVEPLLTDSACSAVLRAYRLPLGRRYDDLHDALKARGFVIYAGQGRLSSDIFRIAHMGHIRDADLDGLTEAFADTLGERA